MPRVRNSGGVSVGGPQYKVKDGFHLPKGNYGGRTAAQVVGESHDRLRVRLGRSHFTVDEYEQFCQNPRDPVHPIWANIKNQNVSNAGRAAAAYLIRSIIYITITTAAGTPQRSTMTIIHSHSKAGGTAFPSGAISRNRNLLAEYEEEFEAAIRGAIESYLCVGTSRRMKQIVRKVLNTYP